MAKKQQHAEEEGGENVPLWYVSFADMITLLLSFFVMLSTFSSYDTEARKKFAGACQYITANSVFPNKVPAKELMIAPIQRPVDFTPKGDERPQENAPDTSRDPKQPPFVDEMEAFRSEKVFLIPLDLLEADGDLTPDGKGRLRTIAEFMRAIPCHVTISQPPNGEPASGRISSQARLARAWRVVEYFVDQEKLPASQFSIASEEQAPNNRYGGRAILKMILQSGGVYE